MNNELRKNVEGYTDPTAAATLNRKESADIWEYKDGECLIIKGHPGFATILRLHDFNKYGDRVKVTDRDDGPRYVDPAFIVSGRYSEMGRYVETLDAATFEKVIIAVEAAIGIDLQTTREATHTAPGDESTKLLELANHMEHLQKELTTLEHRYNLQTAELAAADNAATKARNQLELLREMYNDLLAKVVGGCGE